MRVRLELLTLGLLATSLAAGQEHDPGYLRNVKQLTSNEVYTKAGEAYFSPDGSKILFQGIRPGQEFYYQIYVMNADGSDQRRVSTGKGKTTCSYFDPQDPTKFIYASSHLDERTHAAPPPPKPGEEHKYKWDYESSFDIFHADLATGKILQRLTEEDDYDAECSYSHDGKLICYTSRTGTGDSDIWIMDRDGKHKRCLVRVDGTDGGPFFSPDDQWVLYRASRGNDGSMQVYLTSLDGKTTRQLTDRPRVNWAPFFHPDGQVVCYAGNYGGSHRNFELYLVKADGSKREVRLTVDPEFDGLPSFSPDGKRLLWTSTRDGGESQVFVADFVMPPEEAFQVPGPEQQANPHGGGENPHGQPSSRPTSRPARQPANPHAPKTEDGAGEHGQAEEVKPSGEKVNVPGTELITRADLLRDVSWLADDAREGRAADSDGGRASAAWLADHFQAAGLEPGMGKDYLQPFEFSFGSERAQTGNTLAIGKQVATLDDDWRPLLYSASGLATGELAFAGYGISAPDRNHDDLQDVDLNGKVAVVLTGAPHDEQGGAFGGDRPVVYQDLRYKVSTCRDAGAKAVILVKKTDEGWLHVAVGDPQVPVLQLTKAAAQRLLGLDVAAEVAKLDAGPASRDLGARATLTVKLEHVTGKTQNVVAKLPGQEPGVIVIGAHYDHLGHGGPGSLAPGSKEIHNGADDNASGTSGLLALARAFVKFPPRHTIYFVAFGAEERGLLGSKYFVEHPPVPLANVVAMLNMDMIGRLEGRALVVGGAGTAKEWGPLLQRAADATGLTIQPQADGFGPSDHASFYAQDIPVMFLFSGNHEDYHKPTDDVERLDMDGYLSCARAGYVLARGIDELQAVRFVKVKRADQPRRVVTGESGAYFGSIPNYTQEDVVGVALDGAKEGTPAAKAGIQKGDVLVEFAGHPIKNIYDFVNALKLSKPGQQIEVVVERGGQKVTLQATLEGRDGPR